MVKLTTGNLLEADVEAYVNAVNTAGVMGKGIALQFKQAYPDMFAAYRQACRAGEVRIGQMFVFERGGPGNPRYIINFPTKEDWRAPSRLAYIEQGLTALVAEIRRREIRCIAIPALGSGLGGLDWQEVLPRIRAALEKVPEVEALIYQPVGPGARLRQ